VIRCVKHPDRFGFAHVCDGCGVAGPIRGKFAELRDSAEADKLGHACNGGTSCSAKAEGWQTGGKRDLCPACLEKTPPKPPKAPVGVA
jgi:hypothetical protein